MCVSGALEAVEFFLSGILSVGTVSDTEQN